MVYDKIFYIFRIRVKGKVITVNKGHLVWRNLLNIYESEVKKK